MSAVPESLITQWAPHFRAVQTKIVAALNQLEAASNGQRFTEEPWQRTDGKGGGYSCVIEGGAVFERGGVMFSEVKGDALPTAATVRRPHLAGARFHVCGVSIVLHPRNPFVPTVHLNIRLFTAILTTGEVVWWNGGGMDLTPVYIFPEDAQHFHQTCHDALAPFGSSLYTRFKQQCDHYFYLKHRDETRGVGGIIFDDFNELPLAQNIAMTLGIGQHFLAAYQPIVERRWQTPYGERERDFQAYRRGRYVEFNLIYDRGTLFGLQSDGKTEAILVSMPPIAHWRYNYQPKSETPEAQLSAYLKPREWL